MVFLIPSMFLVLALIHLYHNWRIQPYSLYLSGAIASMAVVFVNYYLFIYGPSVFWLAVFFGHMTPLQLLMGPFLYFYVRGVLTDNHRIRRRDLLHFVPALLDLVGKIPFFLMAWSTKLWMAEEMIRDPNRLHDFSVNFFPPTSIALSLRLLSMIGYTSYGLWLVRRFQGNLSGLLQVPPKAAGTVIRFMKYLLWVCLVAEISFFILQLIFLTDRNLTTGYIVSNPLLMLTFIGILSIPVVIQLHPEVLYGIPRWPGGQQFGNGLLSVPAQNELPTQVEKPENERRREKLGESNGMDRFQELAMRTERILAEKKPYLDPDFSLDDLARLMDVPKHHLYYCFNHILQKKFTQLRAEYRVRHALSLIEGGHTREKTLEAIGLESGFSSRSSFITAFREVTGKLPSEYQQSLAASHPQRPLLQIPLNPVNTASD